MRMVPASLMAALAAAVLAPPVPAATWPQIKKSGTLHAATEGDFRPFNYVEGGALKGFEVELVEAIAKKLKLKLEWTWEKFDNLLPDLAQHKFDLVAASHAVTPDRAKSIEFVNPHYCSGSILVIRKGDPRSLSDLEGKIIGAGEGTTYFDRLKGMSRFKEVRGFKEDADAVEALKKGEIAAWVTDRFVASTLLRSPRGASLDLGDVVFPEMIAMVVEKGNIALRDKINGALAAIMQDGTYERISLHYFNNDIRCRELSRRRRSGSAGM